MFQNSVRSFNPSSVPQTQDELREVQECQTNKMHHGELPA